VVAVAERVDVAAPVGDEPASRRTGLGLFAGGVAFLLPVLFSPSTHSPFWVPKSALLPLVNEAVETRRVSIYNAGVLVKHPLLGLRLTN